MSPHERCGNKTKLASKSLNDRLRPAGARHQARMFDKLPLIGRVVVIDIPNAVAISYSEVAHGLMPAGTNCGVKEFVRMAGTPACQG